MNQDNINFEINRKLLHLSSLWIPVIGFMLPFDSALILFLTIGIAVLSIDAGRLIPGKISKLSFGVIKIFKLSDLYRKSEHLKLSGASYMLFSTIISFLIFPGDIFFISLTILIICDSLAAIIGVKYGNHKIYDNKSWEGVIAFFISALILSICFSIHFKHPIINAIIASFVATIGETFASKLGLDDNLVIPLVFGLSFLIMVP
jgi:dolichol kinase